jgi:hypothetical protein
MSFPFVEKIENLVDVVDWSIDATYWLEKNVLIVDCINDFETLWIIKLII